MICVALFDERDSKIDVQGWVTLTNRCGTTYDNACRPCWSLRIPRRPLMAVAINRSIGVPVRAPLVAAARNGEWQS